MQCSCQRLSMRFLHGIWHLVILGPTQESFSNMLKPRQVLFLTYAGASNDTIRAHPEAPKKLELPTFQPHTIHWLVEKPGTATLLQGALMSHLAKLVRQFDYFIGLEMSEQPFGFRFYGAAVAVVLGAWLAGGF